MFTKLALLGTERGQLTAEMKAKLQQLGIDTTQSPEAILLEGAAYQTIMQKVGFQPKTYTKSLPTKAPEETLPVCNPKSVQHLLTILNDTENNYKAILPEFITKLAKINKRLPNETLPKIFRQVQTQSDIWVQIRQVIGTRGKWLAAQNANWSHLFLNLNEAIWETGTKAQRLHLLKHLRETNATHALTLLKNTWAEESLQDRMAFLKVLETNLSILDEDFLEKCLDARRKEERKVAAKLLIKIGTSALVERMFNRVQPLIKIKLLRLDITLPNTFNDDSIRDGIDPRAQWFKGGLKASRFGQMFAVIPPSRWTKHFKRRPSQLLKLFLKSDWGELLFQALIEATAVHEDREWMELLVNHWIDNHNESICKNVNFKPLVEVLPIDIFNKMTISGLKKAKTNISENHPVVILIKNSNYTWEQGLTIEVVKNFRNWLLKIGSNHWSGFFYKTIFKKAAIHSNPNLYDRLELGWPEESKAWGYWNGEIDTFLGILKFRKTMLLSLEV